MDRLEYSCREEKAMNRPKWMSANTWVAFVTANQNAQGVIACAHCGTTDAAVLSVDHIVPRTENGSDELSNLQPLCIFCNSKKGGRPDQYWSRSFFFDRPLSTGNLRVAQYDFVFNPIIEYADFFGQPASAINGKLFCFFQNVGAGKTLGMFCLPFALNVCAQRMGVAPPRIDRMLLVTKDQALRSQTAAELRDEPVRYGLVPEAPRVVEIAARSQLINGDTNYDIGVMCPHMLWPQLNTANGNAISYSWVPGMEYILQRHPLIIFDEMHYAHAGIRRLVHAARHSLVFGFTASPINSCGRLLEDMIRISVYSYSEAVINDGSMKFLG
jgi:hypothetical protein